MAQHKRHFDLAGKIEHYLATLSTVYARRGDRRKQEIIVNALVRVHEYWESEWEDNRESCGHALYLAVPEGIYPYAAGEREELQSQIKVDLKQHQNVPHEFIAEVFLEMQQVQDRDWRRESGALLPSQAPITPSAERRIWGETGYRLFLSHRAEVKEAAANLKDRLWSFGISAFVAHTDIHPTKEWQDEIEYALASMDAFVALLTDNFHQSDWTDQEVGYALGRGVPLIAVKLGMDPYGFIGKFQALATEWKDLPLSLAKLLANHPHMVDAYIEAAGRCTSFDQGNRLSQLLSSIDTLTPEQAERLASAFNENLQLQGSFGFNGNYPSKHGPGLAAEITRAVGNQYEMTQSNDRWPNTFQIKAKRR